MPPRRGAGRARRRRRGPPAAGPAAGAGADDAEGEADREEELNEWLGGALIDWATGKLSPRQEAALEEVARASNTTLRAMAREEVLDEMQVSHALAPRLGIGPMAGLQEFERRVGVTLPDWDDFLEALVERARGGGRMPPPRDARCRDLPIGRFSRACMHAGLEP